MVRRALRLLAAGAALALGPPVPAAAPAVVLEDAYPGVSFQRPVFAAQPPDGTPRMFVVEQGGRIFIVDHPAPAVPGKSLFLDISGRVSRVGNEEGLLGFAFHPGYGSNRRFFVHYSDATAPAGQRRHRVSEFLARPGNAAEADPSSERVLFTLSQPYENHWGGWIGFGPDGLLYIALGDGGSGGDPGNRAQDLSDFHGKILRLDVDQAGALPEIHAYGLRNPWRCAFDRQTGDLWAGDVGQDAWEEVDRIVHGGNYGWRRREGMHDYNPSAAPPPSPLIDPVAEYGHDEGRSITGGFVYRGKGIPALAGSYLFADFGSGRLWALEDPYGAAVRTLLLDTGENIASFAEDRAGEPYLLSFSGTVLALRDGNPPPPEEGLPALLSDLRLGAGPTLPYRVLSPLWSDGAAKSRFLLLPPDTTVGWRAEDAFDLPVGAFAVKEFSRNGVRLETRVIRRTAEGFDAASYRWRGDLADADRVDARTTLPGGWTVPGPEDCRTCHTEGAGFLLGVTARQIDAATARRWSRAGVLAGAPPAGEVERNARLLGRRGLDARARSYLDANCAYCHRPDEPANGSIDLRATTPLEDTGILDAPPQRGDLGIADARIVAPGVPDRSVLLRRMLLTGEGRMPQLGTDLPDREAARVLRRWIRGLE